MSTSSFWQSYPTFPIVCSGLIEQQKDPRITEETLVVGGFYGRIDGDDKRPFHVVNLDPNNYSFSIQVIYQGKTSPEFLDSVFIDAKFYNYSSVFRNIYGNIAYIKRDGSLVPWGYADI